MPNTLYEGAQFNVVRDYDSLLRMQEMQEEKKSLLTLSRHFNSSMG